MTTPKGTTPWDVLATVFILGAVLTFTAFMAGFPTGFWTAAFWTGEGGFIQVVAAIGGVMTAGTAAIGVYFLNVRTKHSEETLQLQRVAELAGRFQKAVELLAEPSVTSRTAALQLLRHIARSAPSEYHVPILNILSAFLRENTIQYSSQANPKSYEDTPDIESLPQTPRDIIEALAAIGYIRRQVDHAALEADVGRPGGYLLIDVVIKDAVIAEKDFSNMTFASICFISCSFSDCDFSRSKLNGRFFDCVFTRCKMREVKLAGAWSYQSYARVSCVESDLEGASISLYDGTLRASSCNLTGMTLDSFDADLKACWYETKRPRVTLTPRPSSSEQIRLDVKKAAGSRGDDGKFVVRRASKSLGWYLPRQRPAPEEPELPFAPGS